MRIVAIFLLVASALALGGFIVWGLHPLGPTDRALAALQSDSQVTVSQGDWISFQPAGNQPTSGLIFYPGGHVDYRSYAPLAHQLAARGYYVAILPMPLNLAILGVERANAVIAAHPEIRHSAVGGHSLGGVVAAQFAGRHLDQIRGLALLAAYPAGDLAGTDLRGLQVYGSQDRVLNMDRVESTARWLPAATILQVIQGGNHAQFGDYGPQPGDGEASLSVDAQQAEVVDELDRLLRALDAH